MQKGLKAADKISSWETSLGGGSVVRNPNCNLVLGAYSLHPDTGVAVRGLTEISGL